LWPPAPPSRFNVPIGPRRSLIGYRARQPALKAARAGGGTLNDIGLAVVAGALRALSIRQGEVPRAPLKTMIPVSMRRAAELGPGNKISMVYIQLPVDIASPLERLEFIRDQTRKLKGSCRAEDMQTLYAAGGLLPPQLRTPIARTMSSARVFNLTVSQPPGPRVAMKVLGCELEEVYSTVPLAQGHALAIALFRYREDLFIGCHADPEALPEVQQLPLLLDAELRALGAAKSRSQQPRSQHLSNGASATLA
jgi:WS/DGAT/MGAT family acyltransferase